MSNYDGSCRETLSLLSNAYPLSMRFVYGRIFFVNKQSPHGIYWTNFDDGRTVPIHYSIRQATSADYFHQFPKGKWSSWETTETCCSGVCGEEKRKRVCQNPFLSKYNQACVKTECVSYACNGFEEDVIIKNCDDNLCSGCNACSVNNGGCEGECSQLNGGAVCSCGLNGMLKSDGKTCVYQNIIVYSNGSTIKFVSNKTVFNVDIPAGQKIMSLKFDSTNKRIIYGSIERGQSVIGKLSLKGAKITKLIEQRGDIFDIFYDEGNGSLYYTMENYAAGAYKIDNADATALSPTLLRTMSRPKGITVDTCIGYIFVVDDLTRQIIRITSNTLQSTSIITTDLYQPSAITVDPYTEKLFWSDSEYKRIEMANYDGSCREPLYRLSAAIPTMIFYHGLLVFPYTSLKRVTIYNLFTHDEVEISSTYTIQTLDYFSNSVQVLEGDWSPWEETEGCCTGNCGERKLTRICKSPYSNSYLNKSCINAQCKTRFNCNGRHEDIRIVACDKKNCPDCVGCFINNGGCEERCSDVSGSLRCSCNELGALNADGKSCSYSERLVYSNGTTIQFYGVNISIPNNSSKTLKALVEDFSNKRLFYAAVGGGESELGVFTLNGLKYKTLIKQNGSVFELAFNNHSKILYYTIEDSAPGIYMLENIDSAVPTSSSLIHSIEKPTGIVFAKCSGYLFAVDDTAKEIIRIKSDTVTTIISKGLSSPTSVTVDDITGKLFWIDAGLDRIEMSNYDGSCRKTVKVLLTAHPLAILFFKGMLLYTNKQSFFGVHQLDIVTGESTLIKSAMEPVLAVEYFGAQTKKSSWSSWVINENCCSGVCGEEKFIRKCQSPYYSQYEKSCINAICVSSNSCGGQHQQIKKYSCNQAHCNGNQCYGTWGEWEKFKECSKTCGTGVRSRSRLCITSSQLISCFGKSKETLICNETPCTTVSDIQPVVIGAVAGGVGISLTLVTVVVFYVLLKRRKANPKISEGSGNHGQRNEEIDISCRSDAILPEGYMNSALAYEEMDVLEV